MWDAGATVLDGRFRILQAAGLTSGTENYVAEQVSLGRKVSLRVIRAELGVQPDAAERFEREVRKLAAVDHHAVVRVIDSGKSEGRLYIVTEHAEGALLSDELKPGEPLMPERALEVLTQLAEALGAVHEKSLVHGELSPRSVVVSGTRARLLDYGVARLLDAESPHERVTVVARAITSPEYLSPEQLEGRDATPACDVYALGVLAYRVLSGEVPARERPKPLGGHLADQAGLIELVGRMLADDAAKRPTAREAWTKLAKLPRPQEPTLFVEAMQRPPELPPKPAPQAPAPPKLLESVPMLAVTPAPMPAELPPPLPQKAAAKSRLPLIAVGVTGVVAVGLAAFVLSGSSAREARKLIENRQPSQALEVLTKAIRKEPTPELHALRAAALHLSSQHREEESTFRGLPLDAKEAVDPLVLSGIVEDFGGSESSDLRSALKALPQKELKPVLERFAKEPVSMKQWGALRYLDLEDQAKDLKRVELYSISLESSSCGVRRVAAKRLQELDDDSAVEALQRLKETPREGAEKSCGQDEAAAALAALKKLK